MKPFHLVLLMALAGMAFADPPTEPPTTTQASTTVITTTTTTPSTTTTKPTTTTTTTTAAPTTSTTEKPITTSAPTTTDSPHSTTTPSPNPKPKQPTYGKYNLTDPEGKVCLMAWMRVTATKDSLTEPLIDGRVVTNVSKCDSKSATLFVSTYDNDFLQITVSKANETFYISYIKLRLGKIDGDKDNLQQFQTSLKQFYKCSSEFQVELNEGVHVIFSDMKLQAFQASEAPQFTGSEHECTSDYHSDVVIIAIGCALALLVVIILVAYLIARRRNRQRGYQSV